MSLSVSNLTVAYGRTTIISDISFGPLNPGTVVGLIGPNAAGKSTLVKAIAGVKRPSGGQVGVDKHDAIGYVPQDLLSTASLTAFESIMVSARRRGEATGDPVGATADIMERLGITHLADRMVSDMSGGQRQLVGVAQMLVRAPSILLLDEPTSALDIHHQVHLLQLIREEVADTARIAIVAIHDLNLAARFCDELIVLKAGQVLAHDRPAAVLTPELLGEVYNIDARILDDGGVPVICPV